MNRTDESFQISSASSGSSVACGCFVLLLEEEEDDDFDVVAVVLFGPAAEADAMATEILVSVTSQMTPLRFRFLVLGCSGAADDDDDNDDV